MRQLAISALALAAAAALSACGTAREMEESSKATSCTGCHGFPPEALSGIAMKHPANSNCFLCHPATVNEDNEIIAGAHLDGRVEVSSDGLACSACHTLPPQSGLHAFHLDRLDGLGDAVCAVCHPGYSTSSVNADTHLDGALEASPVTTTATFSTWPESCGDCH